MSHIVEAKTTIKNPDLTLLRQAVELVAQQTAGRVEDHYFSYEGQRKRTPLSIFTSMMRRGMAIQVKQGTGELVFVGDSWGYQQHYQEIQQQIVQTYVSLATMKALQSLGYQTTAEDGEGGQVVIAGVTYA